MCLFEPETLWAVGLWYDHFEPTSDAEIAKLLAGGAHDPPRPPMSPAKVRIPLEHGGELVGDLALPAAAAALVVFAHGSGSSRHSARNRQVARWLNERRFATLLLDLLTMEEELDRANVFDIGLLAHRLVAATEWKRGQPALAALSTGYFGASTGAGAALCAAADLGDEVGAVVSRGGRPDLAVARLPEVRAPVLLIVGGHDEIVLELNREARSLMRATSELSVVARHPPVRGAGRAGGGVATCERMVRASPRPRARIRWLTRFAPRSVVGRDRFGGPGRCGRFT